MTLFPSRRREAARVAPQVDEIEFFANAEDDIIAPKTNTRGNVFETYLTHRIADHFDRSVWLNPEGPAYWEADTARVIRRLFPMFHLSVDGITEAVRSLVGGRL